MKNIKRTLSIFLMVAFILPILPLVEIATFAENSSDIIIYINDVGITAERCGLKDGNNSDIPIIIGVPSGIIKIKPSMNNTVEIILNGSNVIRDIGTISAETNIPFGTSIRPLEQIYTVVCGSYKILLLATSSSTNHVQFTYNGYTDYGESENTYIINSAGTAIFNTSKAYNGGRSTYSFYIKAFRANGYYDPTGKTGTMDTITQISFTLTDFDDGDVEPWWPSGQTPGNNKTYVCSSGALTISGATIFPAQYKISFPVKTGGFNIDYFIALSGTPVIPVSAEDNLLRRWNDVGSILTKVNYKNPGESTYTTVDLSPLYLNISSTLGAQYSYVVNSFINGRLTNDSSLYQKVFNEFYLFYTRGMDSGALYANSNDHARFTRLINEILNSTGAGYLQASGKQNIEEGAVITAEFDRIIGIRIYGNQEFREYYLYNSTGKREFPQKLRNGSMIYHDILGITKYGGYIFQMGTNTLEPFPIFANSIGKNGPYEIWGYRLSDNNELYAVSDTLNTNQQDRTPYEWSQATVDGWVNQKSFTETFSYQPAESASELLKVKIVLLDGATKTSLEGSVICNGISYETNNKEALINIKNGDILEFTEAQYIISGRPLTSSLNISISYGYYDDYLTHIDLYELNKDEGSLTIYVKKLTVSAVDDILGTEIPCSLNVIRKNGTVERAVPSDTTPTTLTVYFIRGESLKIAAKHISNNVYVSTPSDGCNITLSNAGSSQTFNDGTRAVYIYSAAGTSTVVIYLPHLINYYNVSNGMINQIVPTATLGMIPPVYLSTSTSGTLSSTQFGKTGTWYRNQACTNVLPSSTVSYANLCSLVIINEPLNLYFNINLYNVSVEIRENNQIRTGSYLTHLGSNLILKPVQEVKTTIETVKAPVIVGSVMYGDLNFDGIVDSSDETLLKDYIENKATLSNIQKVIADVDKNGQIDKYDLKYIRDCISNEYNIKTFYVSKGDLNGDNIVNSDDISFIIDICNEGNNISTSHNLFKAADINNDNSVDIVDISYTQEYVSRQLYEIYYYQEQKYGDINADGLINTTDAIALRLYLIGVDDINPAILTIADVNHDGMVNELDYFLLREYIYGIVDTLGCVYVQYSTVYASTWSLNYDSLKGIYSTTQSVPAGMYQICTSSEDSMDKYISVDSNHSGQEVLNYYSYSANGDSGVLISYPANTNREYTDAGIKFIYEKNSVHILAIPNVNYTFKNWKYDNVNGEIITINNVCEICLTKHTEFFAETYKNTLITINLDDNAWENIEMDTDYNFDISIKDEINNILYPSSYSNGEYIFNNTSTNTLYSIYLNGKYIDVDIVAGEQYNIDFYVLTLNQQHITDIGINPFEKVYVDGTIDISTPVGYKKSISAYLPSYISIYFSNLPFMAGEQIPVKAASKIDTKENKQIYSFNYWKTVNTITGDSINATFKELFADINNDGVVNTADYILLRQYILGIVEFTEDQLRYADIVEDGRIDDNDWTVLRDVILAVVSATGSSQKLVMPAEPTTLTAYGNDIYYIIKWQDFYNAATMEHENEIIQYIKYGTSYAAYSCAETHITETEYKIFKWWTDESDAQKEFPIVATEDAVYMGNYIDRMYYIEYRGKSDDGKSELIARNEPCYEGDEVIMGEYPGYDEYYIGTTLYRSTGRWICNTGSYYPDRETIIEENNVITVNYNLTAGVPDKSDYVGIVFEKEYEIIGGGNGEKKVNYYIYNNSAHSYKLEHIQFYQDGDTISSWIPPVKAGYVFDGWHWYSEDGSLTEPETMGNEDINAYGRYSNLIIEQTWNSIEGHNEFRRGTDIIFSFTAQNIGSIDYLTSISPTATITIYEVNDGLFEYELGNVLKIETFEKLVLVPSGESTIIWTPYHINADYNTNLIVAKCEVCTSTGIINVGYGEWFVESKIKVQTPDTAYTPQKAWWYDRDYHIGNVNISESAGIDTNVVSSVSWIEWREPLPGKLVRFENEVSVDYQKSQTYIAPYGDKKAKYDNSDLTWKTKSGYGYTLLGTVSLKYSNPEIESSGATTGVQGASALFPEFNYLSLCNNDARYYITYNKSDVSTRNGFKNMIDNEGNILFDTVNGGYYGTYATLQQIENGNFVLPINTTTMKNVHYTPIWMPNGGYQVAVYYHDIWTPAGMLSYYDFSNALKLVGNMYDDIWIWSQSYNPDLNS